MARLSGMARRASLIYGAMALAAVGRDRFSLAMQGRGPSSRMLLRFAEDPELGEIVDRSRYMRQHWLSPVRSFRSKTEYGDDDLAGYGTEEIKAGDQHLPLEQQIRGLVLPHMHEILSGADPLRVVEIGHGNGDVLALLARCYPPGTFVGVDFSIKSAQRHQIQNVAWKAGYALEMLRAGELDGDVLFAASTFCYAGPLEMKAYAEAISDRGYRSIVISDMCGKVWSPERYPNEFRYMHKGVTGYDYRRVFGQVGFETTSFKMVDYKGHAAKAIVRQQLIRLDRR